MAASSYFLYHSLQKATGSRHCCLAKFYNGDETNIITCSSNTMTVYKIVKHTGEQGNGESGGSPEYTLKIADEFSFNGEILCVVSAPIRKLSQLYSSDKRDGLIMSFRGNYVSTVAFDKREGGLETFDSLDLNNEAVVALNGEECLCIVMNRQGGGD